MTPRDWQTKDGQTVSLDPAQVKSYRPTWESEGTFVRMGDQTFWLLTAPFREFHAWFNPPKEEKPRG